MTPVHASWDELAAGYAVNALEPEEEQAFAEHLHGCQRCQDTLSELSFVNGQLAYVAEPVTPPADLGRRILRAAMEERPGAFGTAPPPARVLPSIPRVPKQRRDRVWQPTFRVASLATAAAVLAVLGLGTWNFTLRNDSRAQLAALERRDRALECLAGSETPKFPMTSPGGQRATSCLSGGRAYVVVDHLDANDRNNSVYVLWYLGQDRKLRPIERFDVGTAGTAVYELPMNATASDVKAMAISLERGRSIPATPTRRVVFGEASAA